MATKSTGTSSKGTKASASIAGEAALDDDARRDRVPSLDEANQIIVANQLIKLGARIAVVTNMTRIPAKKLRRLYREWTDKDPVPGHLPSDASFYTQDLIKSLHSSVFLALYRYYTTLKPIDTIGPELLIQTYRAYLAHFDIEIEDAVIDINRAWYMLRAYRSGFIVSQTCRWCKSNYVVSTAYSRQGCPVCTILSNSKCIDCGTPIREGKDLLQTKGKKRCATCQSRARNRRISMQRIASSCVDLKYA